MADEEKQGIRPDYAPASAADDGANIMTFESTKGIARLTPVHIELVSSALKRAGATGLKPKWIEKDKRAQLKFEGLPSDQAIEVASAAVSGSGLQIQVAAAG